MSLIKGIHHVALKPTEGQYNDVISFYTEVLGLSVKKSWGHPEYPCVMISTGDNSCVEVLPQLDGELLPVEGKFAHLALATDDVDGCVEAVRKAGYQITDEPMDMELAGMPIRVAFCRGAAGEVVEFFCEK